MNIQQILDYPIWSKVALNNSGLARFFATPGPSADSGIDAALQIDKSALFTMHMLEINLMQTDGAPITAANQIVIAQAIKNVWINFTKNGGERIGRWSLSNLLAAPQEIITSGGYDLTRTVKGQKILNVPADIPGGQSLEFTLNWPSTVNLTGITAEAVLYGVFDRTKATT